MKIQVFGGVLVHFFIEKKLLNLYLNKRNNKERKKQLEESLRRIRIEFLGRKEIVLKP